MSNDCKDTLQTQNKTVRNETLDLWNYLGQLVQPVTMNLMKLSKSDRRLTICERNATSLKIDTNRTTCRVEYLLSVSSSHSSGSWIWLSIPVRWRGVGTNSVLPPCTKQQTELQVKRTGLQVTVTDALVLCPLLKVKLKLKLKTNL